MEGELGTLLVDSSPLRDGLVGRLVNMDVCNGRQVNMDVCNTIVVTHIKRL